MKISLKEYIMESIYNKINEDKRTLDDFAGGIEIVKAILKDSRVKKHLKALKMRNNDIYFDGGDLVLVDKTIASNLLSADGFDYKTSIDDLVKKILNVPVPKKPKKSGSGTGDEINGMSYSNESDTRIVFTADDSEAKKLKDNKVSNVTVRIMKRKNGNKVYVDAKNKDGIKEFLTKLKGEK